MYLPQKGHAVWLLVTLSFMQDAIRYLYDFYKIYKNVYMGKSFEK